MTTDARTLATYAAEARRYAATMAGQAPPPLFDALMARLASGATVLDFGCGTGWAAQLLQGRGMRVTALDPSAAMIEAGALPPGITTICGEVGALPAGARYDAIWAHFSLQHVLRAELPETLGQLAARLKPQGHVAIAIHEGNETLRDSLDRLYCHWTEAGLTALLAEHGLRVLEVLRAPDRGYDGRAFTALGLIARTGG